MPGATMGAVRHEHVEETVAVDRAFDWAGLRAALTAAAVAFVERAIAARPGDQVVAVALAGVHREEDGVVSMPVLGALTAGDVASWPAADRAALRWSVPD